MYAGNRDTSSKFLKQCFRQKHSPLTHARDMISSTFFSMVLSADLNRDFPLLEVIKYDNA